MSNPETGLAVPACGLWTGKSVIVGVGGGIAAYKAATLVSRLAQRGAEVQVLMTESATKFVTPLTFESLSGRPVFTSIWQSIDRPDSQHIALARRASMAIIAPATANLIAKFANGMCDDVVSLVLAALPRESQTVPVLLAPGMNADMWANPAIQANMNRVRQLLGWSIVGPESGWQACRTSGPGRMSEPDTILAEAERLMGLAG